MTDYFQKILSRSAPATTAGKATEYVLPSWISHPFEGEGNIAKNSETELSEIEPTESQQEDIERKEGGASPDLFKHRPDKASTINNKRSKPGAHAGNDLSSNSDQIKIFHTQTSESFSGKGMDAQQNNEAEGSPSDKMLRQPVIANITSTKQEALSEKVSTGITPGVTSKDDSNLIVLTAKNIQQKQNNGENPSTTQDAFHIKQFPETKTGQKITEMLAPAVPENVFTPPAKGTTSSKLVIGRITVEVITPAKPVAKAKGHVPLRNSADKVSTREFSAINKLNFGWGQL